MLEIRYLVDIVHDKRYALSLFQSCFLKYSFKFFSDLWHGWAYDMLAFVGTWGRIIAETQMLIAGRGATPLTQVWDGSTATWRSVMTIYKSLYRNLLRQLWNQILVRIISAPLRNNRKKQVAFYAKVIEFSENEREF